jgi:hypothetical protein
MDTEATVSYQLGEQTLTLVVPVTSERHEHLTRLLATVALWRSHSEVQPMLLSFAFAEAFQLAVQLDLRSAFEFIALIYRDFAKSQGYYQERIEMAITMYRGVAGWPGGSPA